MDPIEARLQLEAAERRRRAAEKAERSRNWQEAHSAELEERRQARVAEREARRAQWAADHEGAHETSEDRHAKAMAESLGMTVVDFKDLQERRRAEMRGKGKISYSPDHEVR